jgi:hypothetical protein
MPDSPNSPSTPDPRQPGAKPGEPEGSPGGRAPTTLWDAKRLEKWTKGIGFGVFILAAVALAVYSAAVGQLASKEDLEDYGLGLLIAATLLFVMSYGVRLLRRLSLPRWLELAFIIPVALAFVVFVLSVAGWAFTKIARNAGWISPLQAAPSSLPAVSINNIKGAGADNVKAYYQIDYVTERVDGSHMLMVETATDNTFQPLLIDPAPLMTSESSTATIGIELAKAKHGLIRLVIIKGRDRTQRLSVSNFVNF